MAKKKPIEVEANIPAILRDGINQPFWQYVKSVIQANLDELLDNILNDPTLNEPVPMTKRERVIDWYGMNKKLLDLPESVLKSLEDAKTEPVSFDPYESVKDDIYVDTK